MLKLVMTFIISIMLSVLAAGCSNETAAKNDKAGLVEKNTATEVTVTQQEKNINFVIYYPDMEATGLYATEKKASSSNKEKYKKAIELLLAGSNDKRLTSAFPNKTKLLEVKVENNIAYANFNKDLVNSFNGGSTGEELLLGSLVNTLTEFPEIKGVQILVEGRKLDTLGGHMDISKPLTRIPELIVK